MFKIFFCLFSYHILLFCLTIYPPVDLCSSFFHTYFPLSPPFLPFLLSLPFTSTSRHNMGVSWMRRSEYISAEYNRFIQSAEKAESRVGYHLKKMQKDEDVYKDRESQIAAIEKTFEDAKVPIEKHFNKPGVYAVEVIWMDKYCVS